MSLSQMESKDSYESFTDQLFDEGFLEEQPTAKTEFKNVLLLDLKRIDEVIRLFNLDEHDQELLHHTIGKDFFAEQHSNSLFSKEKENYANYCSSFPRSFDLLELNRSSRLFSIPLLEKLRFHSNNEPLLTLQDRIKDYLCGQNYLSDELYSATIELEVNQENLGNDFKSISEIEQDIILNSNALINLVGFDTQTKRQFFVERCIEEQKTPHLIYADELKNLGKAAKRIGNLFFRESILSKSLFLIELQADDDPIYLKHIKTIVENAGGAIIISSEEELEENVKAIFNFEIKNPSADEQKKLWKKYLGKNKKLKEIDFQMLVGQFHFSSSQINRISKQFLNSKGKDFDLLWEQCRLSSRKQMNNLAQRIVSKMTWHDIILQEEQKDRVEQIIRHVKYRNKIYHEWGFADKSSKGLGVLSVFTGPSGTGKTLAAEVIANELNLDLYRVDLSTISSKYVGETEKNLKKIFDAADQSGCILLFDEGDSLFSTRSEGSNANDKHANNQINYLLQRIENYRGLAIITTNFSLHKEENKLQTFQRVPELVKSSKSKMDTAFMRRIKYIVHFEYPDFERRKKIWKKVFPAKAPLAQLNYDELAKLSATGALIQNIALHASFLALENTGQITMEDLLVAAKAEFKKLNTSIPPNEILHWVN